jgi:hypothetical protein
MESIFNLSVRLSLLFSPFSDLQPWILIEDYIRINDTFGFYDSSSIRSEIELGLEPSQIKILFE